MDLVPVHSTFYAKILEAISRNDKVTFGLQILTFYTFNTSIRLYQTERVYLHYAELSSKGSTESQNTFLLH